MIKNITNMTNTNRLKGFNYTSRLFVPFTLPPPLDLISPGVIRAPIFNPWTLSTMCFSYGNSHFFVLDFNISIANPVLVDSFSPGLGIKQKINNYQFRRKE
jgi:hypothetical protein